VVGEDQKLDNCDRRRLQVLWDHFTGGRSVGEELSVVGGKGGVNESFGKVQVSQDEG